MPIAQLSGGRDLASRDDIEVPLWHFYGNILHDKLLAAAIAEVRARGLEYHLPTMCDLWETVLFRTGHRTLPAQHAARPPAHALSSSVVGRPLLRWLTLWNTTIDQLYRGPLAEHAKIRAARIAASLHRRLTGGHTTELEARAVSSASMSRTHPGIDARINLQPR